MRSVELSTTCVICEDEIEFTGEIIPAERDVGIMRASVETEEAPLQCPKCGGVYTPEQHKEMTELFQRTADNYDPEDGAGDYLYDTLAERELDHGDID